jgi:hypothetical protein
MSATENAPDYWQDMASGHGMSADMFDMLDITGGEDITVSDVRDELSITTAEAKSLLTRATDNGYLWKVPGKNTYMFTPKGAGPFGGLRTRAVQELQEAGWTQSA